MQCRSRFLSITVAIVAMAFWFGQAPAANVSWNTGDGDWSHAFSWSPAGAPQPDDVAYIGNLAVAEDIVVTLDQDDTIAGLSITNLNRLETNGNSLLVLGDTTLSGGVGIFGSASGILVERGVGVDDFDTDNLALFDGASLTAIDGGIVDIDESVVIDEHSTISGHDQSIIRLNGNSGASLVNDGTIDGMFDGGLIINQLGTARIDLDGTFGNGVVTATHSNIPMTVESTLTINGDQLHDDFNGAMHLAQGGTINMNLSQGWRLGSGGTLRFSGPQLTQLNGGEVTVGGDVVATFEANARINADVVLEAAVDMQLYTDSQLAIYGAATIEGGDFTIRDGAILRFFGPTIVAGGDFSPDVATPSEGSVLLDGPTTWLGDATFGYFVRQGGDAGVIMPTTITAETYDMDGFGGTQWLITQPLTVNADYIDSVVNQFDGSMTVSGPASSLTINLNNPLQPWHMAGTLQLSGSGGATRLAGSHVVMAGTVGVSGELGISADTTFANGNSLELIGAATELVMRGETRVENGAVFNGPGTLVNDANGTMILEDGALVSVALINNGRLEVGATAGQATVAYIDHASTGEMQFVIAGTTPGSEYSQLVSNTNAEIQGGTLEILTIAPSYEDPSLAGELDEFLLLTSSFLSGEFDAVFYDGTELDWEFTDVDTYRSHEGGGLFRIVDYTDSDVSLTNYRALLGDANGDGTVDGQDFVIWNANKFNVGTDWTTGDFNGDGITDGQDFVMWNSNKFASVDFALMSVPEPSASMMLMVVTLHLLCTRRLRARWS